MTRHVLALGAIVLSLWVGSSSASAYNGDNDWMDGAFSRAERSSAAAERRATTRSRTRTASVAPSSEAESRPQRRAAVKPSLPSLTGARRGGDGLASYYWQPQRLASGGWFNPNAMTAAHKTLPFGTRVKVTNLANGRAATVTINDRGPYVAGRVIDLSSAAAGVVGMKGAGVTRVKLDILGR